MTFEPDAVMLHVGDALAKAQQGDRAGARSVLESLWGEVGDDGDPFHRCAIAHSMADVQEDPHEELHWDLLALAAAEELTDERVAAGGVEGSAAGFYPSLHLNLADVYLRLEQPDLARMHLAAGRTSIGTLEDSGYKTMVTDALDRIDRVLRERSSATS